MKLGLKHRTKANAKYVEGSSTQTQGDHIGVDPSIVGLDRFGPRLFTFNLSGRSPKRVSLACLGLFDFRYIIA